MADYTSRSKEYAAQEKADKKRQAADVKAGEAAIKKRNKEDAKRLKGIESGTLNTYTEAKSYGGGRYRQPRRAMGILADAKRLLRI
tara:strand:+ start:120 stop:377 length:258 start_codon:yes stop_codon:yes gene_type:complete